MRPLFAAWLQVVAVAACVGSDPEPAAAPGSDGGPTDGAPSSDAAPGSDAAGADAANDGEAPPKSENVTRWATALAPQDQGFGVAVAPDGSSYAIGTFSGATTIDGTSLASAGGDDVWLAKIGDDGKVAWAKRYGGPGTERGLAVTLLDDGSGDVVVVGTTDGRFDIPGLAAQGVSVNDPPRPGTSTFVARLGGSDGGPRWAVVFGTDYEAGSSPSADSLVGVVGIAARGSSLVFSGRYTNTFEYATASGGSASSPPGGSGTNFLAKLDPANGKVTKMLAPLASIAGFPIALASTGDVVVSGRCSGQLTLGGKTYDATGKDASGFAARLDPQLENAQWLVGWGTTGAGAALSPEGVAIDADRVAVTGWFSGTADFGKGAASANVRDAFVLGLDASTGTTAWSSTLGGGGTDEGRGAAVDRWGQVVAVGEYTSSDAKLGGAAMPAPIGATNAFGMKLDHDGKLVWGKAVFATTPPAQGSAKLDVVGATSTGDLVTGGALQGSVDVGLTSHVVTRGSGAGIDQYVIRWSP